MASFRDRLIKSYNILTNNLLPTIDGADSITSMGATYSRIYRDTSAKVMAPIVTRIAMDVASIPIRHVDVDGDGNFLAIRKGELNDRLEIQANIDQSGRAFVQDACATELEKGVAVLVPIETSTDFNEPGSFDVLDIRVGNVVEWFNRSVMVDVYNEIIGERVQIILPKSGIGIPYNPLYSIMNEQNSTLRRLIDKLALLDLVDSKSGSPNLDLLLQLPYAIKNDKRQEEAERRLGALEAQLNDGKYGIAYIGSTEKVTQLNRAVENTLGARVSDLEESLYNQLGLTPNIFAGTAKPEETLAYYNRTVLPIARSISDSMRTAFLSRTAIKRGQSVIPMPNIFELAPIDVLADAADKFTRNEIMTSNEIRAKIGLKPDESKEANELRNKNLNKEANPKEDEELDNNKSESDTMKEVEE